MKTALYKNNDLLFTRGVLQCTSCANLIYYHVYIRVKRLEWFGHVWRAENDILQKVLTETIYKKKTTRQTKNEMEKYSREECLNVDGNVSIKLAFDRER